MKREYVKCKYSFEIVAKKNEKCRILKLFIWG